MSAAHLESARIEVKFVARETEATRLVNWLRNHPEGFVQPYPCRWVNNVYFDTFEGSCYAENLAGTSHRTKVRYRWYGDTPDAAGRLEIKRKRNVYGWKHRYDTAHNPFTNGGTWRSILEELARSLPAEGRVWLQEHPQPMLINRYFRQYFVTADGTVRMTVDNQQAVFDQRFGGRPNMTRRAHIPPTTVLEVKFARGDREHANRIIQGLPLRVSRHSKYMTAAKALVTL